MRRNGVNSASGLKNRPHHRVQRPRFLINRLKLWRFYNIISEFWAYSHRACAETAIYELPVKKFSPPFAPATSISYKTDAFPLPDDVYWIYSMFLCYYYLVTLTFDLLTLGLFRVQCFSCLTHTPIFIILWLSVTELRVLNIWSHFHYLKQSLRMRLVTWPLTGGKNSPHFWNPSPQFAYSLCHFHGATTKIKPCYRQKIAFSHYGGYKVYCACAVSRDLCIGGPQNHT